jgi:hypothetical protein
MKRTFVVPDDKVWVYERFKEIVPEVSSALVSLMEDHIKNTRAQRWPISLTKNKGE